MKPSSTLETLSIDKEVTNSHDDFLHDSASASFKATRYCLIKVVFTKLKYIKKAYNKTICRSMIGNVKTFWMLMFFIKQPRGD